MVIFFNDYVLTLNEVIFGEIEMTTKLGYAPKWGSEHTARVEKMLKSKAVPMTILEAIMKI